MNTPTLPPALVPAEVNLQDFDFMPLDVRRLRDSDLAAEVDPAVAWFALMLWCYAWHQIPAASLPNNDVSLAKATGFGRDVKAWLMVKEEALRGFTLCDDGRYYHAVVAEKALNAWIGKLKARLKGGKGNASRWGASFPQDEIERMLRRAEAARAALIGAEPPSDDAPPPTPPRKKEAPPASPPVPDPPPPPPSETPKETPSESPGDGVAKRGRKPRLNKSRPKVGEEGYSAGFEAFWLSYPDIRRVQKMKCFERWNADELEDMASVLIRDVEDRKVKDWKWLKDGGQYVPQPLTYLNQRRWNDAMEPPPVAAGRRSSTEQNNNRVAGEWADNEEP